MFPVCILSFPQIFSGAGFAFSAVMSARFFRAMLFGAFKEKRGINFLKQSTFLKNHS